MDAGDYAAAEGELRSSLNRFGQGEPETWRSGRGRIALGTCLLALARYAEAEPLLVDGYAQLQESRGNADEHTVEALRRLIELCQATGRPQQAASYKSLLQP